MPPNSSFIPTLERLLGAGYLPEVLPPCFNSELFGALFAPGKSVPPEFDADPNERVPKESKCVRYNQAKVGGTRRQFSIPNPVHFYRLAQFFLQHWSQLEPLANRSTISLTTPTLSSGRHCFRPAVNFELRPTHRARVRASARYILRADIARFFPSLYTHCIPWAIHGKKVCKDALLSRNSGSLFGNELDKRFRALQDRQSIGIPVGQDISRVIAEIVLGAVESTMPYRRFPVGMRCIDDYEIGFIRRQDAAEFRNQLGRALNEFELALNPLKTNILTLPQVLLDRWDSELRAFDFGESPFEASPFAEDESAGSLDHAIMSHPRTAPNPDRLLLFLNKAIQLQREHPEEAVLRFSLVRITHFKITEQCWPLLQDYLLQCALNQPETLRVVVSNLLKAEFIDEQKVDRKRLTAAINAIVESAAPLGHSSDVAWALWTALLFECNISRAATKALSQFPDAVAACLTCELKKKKLLAGKPSLTSLRESVAVPGSLYGDNWLLAYESARHRWLGRSRRDLAQDPCFAFLAEQKVGFFVPQTSKQLKKQLQAVAQQAAGADRLSADDESDSEDAFDLWWIREDSADR